MHMHIRTQPCLLLLSIGLLAVVAAAFYLLQNSHAAPGGQIAPVKVAWLLTVIIYWFVLPLFWATDKRLSRHSRIACSILLVNMLLRAAFELPMMYITDSWLHIYGIGHDLFSACLCVCIAWQLRHNARWLALYFFTCSVLFLFETWFADYLRRASDGDGSVFFLGPDQAHSTILSVTGIVVSLAVIAGVLLTREWWNVRTLR